MNLSTRVRVRVNNESEKDKGLIPSLPLHSRLVCILGYRIQINK